MSTACVLCPKCGSSNVKRLNKMLEIFMLTVPINKCIECGCEFISWA